ncbi:MAG: LicD family protein [Oscillospiraceae bacterium]|nr:LicD family protein [Oscillospiraceae bacterium]
MDLNELHEKLFGMLVMFDGICKKHNITYFLDSGTAIGAVREHDFIPWDDDIDVAMMRSDYNKLRRVLKKELPSHYKLIEPKDYAPYFFDMVPKLIDMDVPLREETDADRAYKNYQNRMSIDFFILDSVPDNRLLQKIIIFRTKVIYGLLRSKRYSADTHMQMNLFEKAASSFLSFAGRFFSLKLLLNMYHYNTMKYAGIKSNTLIKSNSILNFVNCYDKDWYADVSNATFHGHEFPVPIGNHEILTQLYGDYMIPKRNYKGFVSHI